MKNWLGTLLLLTLVPTVAACGDDEEPAENRDVSAILALLPTADAQSGQVVYEQSCADMTCHGSTGDNGSSGSDLSTAVPPLTDAEVAEVIKYGNTDDGGTMGPVNIPDQDIADVIAYVNQQFR